MKRNKEYVIWEDASYLSEEDENVMYEDYLACNTEIDADFLTPKEQYIYDAVELWLEAEIENLNIDVPNGIVGIACLGLWNGERLAYHKRELSKVSDCLNSMGIDGYYRFFVLNGDLCATCSHHDGTNHYTFREWRDNVTEAQKQALRNALYDNDFERAERLTKRYTKGLGKRIAEIYGW